MNTIYIYVYTNLISFQHNEPNQNNIQVISETGISEQFWHLLYKEKKNNLYFFQQGTCTQV